MGVGLATKYNFDIRRPLTHTSNGKSITAGASNGVLERIVEEGDNIQEPVFPSCWVHEDTIHIAVRLGQGHNQTVNGNIYYFKSTDGGVTVTGKTLVQAADSVLIITNPDIIRTPSGRLLITYMYEGVDGWHSYSRASDDDGATWQDESPMRDYTGFTGQWASPGGFWTQGGRVFKMINYRDQGSGLGSCRVLEYTEATDSWSNFSTVLPAPSLQSFEEPGCCVGPNGAIYAAIRSDVATYQGGYLSVSLDGGRTWPYPTRIIESSGRNAIAISPSNTIMIAGRELSLEPARQWIAWSFNNGLTWTEGFADEGTGNGQYGDIKWSDYYGCFFHVYASTVDGGDTYGGPMHMIIKRWIES